MRHGTIVFTLLTAVCVGGCVASGTHEATKTELAQARAAAVKVAQSFADYKKEAAAEAERLKQQAAVSAEEAGRLKQDAAASAAEAEALRQERAKVAEELQAARGEASRVKETSAMEIQTAREERARVAAELEATREKLAVLEQTPPPNLNVAMTVSVPQEMTEKLKRLEEDAVLGLEDRRRLERKVTELEEQLTAARKAEADAMARLEAEAIRITLVDRLLFESGEADLKPAACQALKQFGEKLKQATDRQIRVEGHTDNKLPKPKLRVRYPSNWELSTARAINVVRCLIRDGGLSAGTLSAVGYGDSRPVADNGTEEGRRKNRRVEIVLYPAPRTGELVREGTP
jgi:chemotaxis protein MotB